MAVNLLSTAVSVRPRYWNEYTIARGWPYDLKASESPSRVSYPLVVEPPQGPNLVEVHNPHL